MNFERPILIYSDFCLYSNKFLEILIKHSDVYKECIRLNIDVEPDTKRRPRVFYQLQQELSKKAGKQINISRVPTIITKNAEYILSDKEAFKWLDFEIKSKSKKSIEGYNTNEMSSFSDGYAQFGSTHINDAKEQNFKFFNNGKLKDDNYLNCNVKFDKQQFANGFLDNLQESSNDRLDFNSKQVEREQMDASYSKNRGNLGRMELPQKTNQQKITNNDYESIKNMRQGINNSSIPNQNIDWQNPNFGLSGELSNSNINFSSNSEKQKEMDDRLQRLILERQELNFDPKSG